MENRRRYSGLLIVLGALLLGVSAQQQGRLVGSDVTLVPQYPRDLKEIIWRINNSIAVEIELDPLTEHTFKLPKDRVTINNTNGALTIRNLTVGNSGFYTAEMVSRDNRVDKTNITLTVRVPLAINKTVGEDIILMPQYTGDPSEIKWTVNGKKLVEKRLKPLGDPTFHHLQDRATISQNDGSLTIRHLTIEDSGIYKAEVTENNGIQETGIKVTVLKSSRQSGWSITGIVLLVLAVIAIPPCYCCYKKYRRPPKEPSHPFESDTAGIVSSFITNIIDLCCYCCRRPNQLENEWKSDSQPLLGKELERCITVQFCNDVTNGNDKSKKPFEDHLKTIIIHSVLLVDDGIFTADGKKCRFTKVENSLIIEYEDGETEQELVCMKDGVTMFEYAFSSLKLHASNITLEPGSVTVYNAKEKESYIVFFRLEEHPESKSICCITFHHNKMTGIDRSTWKKDRQRLNIDGKRIKCDRYGDLTIYDATYQDKGKYTVQCKDKKPDLEFILHL